MKLKVKTKLFIGTVLSLMLFLSSCDSNRIFEENKELINNCWSSDNIIKFEVDIDSLETPTNFYINIRISEGYPYSNLFLFIKTTFPNGKMANDTLDCILADLNGKWIGSGMGDIYDNQIPFKKNVLFPEKGKYVFELQHGMRQDIIPLILDVGLRIEKVEK